MRSRNLIGTAWLSVLLLNIAPAAGTDTAMQSFLEQALIAAREQHHLPAVAAVTQIKGKLAAEAALGVRALGRTDAVTTQDQ